MRVLLDACASRGVWQALTRLGDDVVWAGDWKEDPGDEEILARAVREGRILVTLDKDFGELAIVRGRKHGGVIRLVSLTSADQARVCAAVLRRYSQELERRAIVTAERTRVRVRPAERPP